MWQRTIRLCDTVPPLLPVCGSAQLRCVTLWPLCCRYVAARVQYIDSRADEAVIVFPVFLRLCFDPSLHVHTNSYDDGNRVGMSSMQYRQEIRKSQLLRSRRFLVRKLAEPLVTASLITRGTRVSRPVKHGRSPRQPLTDSQTLLNNESFLLALA